VDLVRSSGKSIGAVAKDLSLTETEDRCLCIARGLAAGLQRSQSLGQPSVEPVHWARSGAGPP
jgi:hypothetical protein